MPIYEYKCPKCGTKTEKIAKRDQNYYCERCNVKLNRIVSCGHFNLKGDNWEKKGFN